MAALYPYLLMASLTVGTQLPAKPAEITRDCAPRAAVLFKMASQYRETPAAWGRIDASRILELLLSSDGETWTIAATYANGATCLVAAGDHWTHTGWKPPARKS